MNDSNIRAAVVGRMAFGLACGIVGAGCSVEALDPVQATGTEAPGATSEQLESPPSRDIDAATRFYAPPPKPAAVKQVISLAKQRRIGDAVRVAEMATTPQAVWFGDGSPQEVKAAVRQTMHAAARSKTTPVLVAYNLPYRDCAQYSAGGAVDTAAYEAWIDGFASGIGTQQAVVVLEPDGLGLIPYNKTIFGAEEWCKPTVTDAHGNSVPAPGASPEARYAQLTYAVASLRAKAPAAAIFLDGTHSAWLGVNEAASRLYRAGFVNGVQQVQGFFLNVSNYQTTSDNTQFGTWVSMCLAAGTPGVGPDWMRDATTGAPHFDWCPSQYDPATGYTQVNYSPEFAAGITAGLEGLLAGASPQVPFVIDTGRNGHGPWQPPASASYPDAQIWCNAPGRGLGLRPAARPGDALTAAYLWIKTPGESDGSCNRGLPGGTVDPEWGGTVDPKAGGWFPAQALELARLASPPLF